MASPFTMAQRFGAGFRNVVISALSGGSAAAANLLVQTGADGFIPDSFLHPALVSAPIPLPAAVNIAAGKEVNIFNNNGTISVQLADATASPPLRSDGYVLAAAASGNTAQVYRRGGVNNALSGLTAGADYYLGAAGNVTTTQNTTPGQLDQYIGYATSATALDQLPPQPSFQN